MHITLHSSMPLALNQHLAADLGAKGYGLQLAPGSTNSFALHFGSNTDWQALQQLQQALQPFTPPWQEDATLAPNTVVLHLGVNWSENALLQLFSDTDSTLRQLHHHVEHLGFTVHEAKQAYYEQGVIAYSPALQSAAQQLAYWAARQQVNLQLMQVAGSDNEQALMLYYPDPHTQSLSAEQRFQVEVVSDAPSLADDLKKQLQQAGFTQVVVLPASKPISKFKVSLGPLRSAQFLPAKASLLQALSHTLQQHGVDTQSYRLQLNQQRTLNRATATRIRIHYPVGAALQGQLAPYSGDTPKRLTLTLKTDAPALAEPLAQQLTEAGFNRPTIVQQPMPNQGFMLECNTEELPLSINLLKENMQAAIKAQWQLHSGEFTVQLKHDMDLSSIIKPGATKNLTATLYLPALGHNREERLATLSGGAGSRLVVYSPTVEAWQAHLFSAQPFAFSKIEYRHTDDVTAKIQYGGANPRVLQALSAHCENAFALSLALDKSWTDTDTDVFLFLPAYQPEQTLPRLPMALPQHVNAQQAKRPFIVQHEDTLKVADQVLLVNNHSSPLVPSLADYASFCLDQTTANTLYFLAQSVAKNEPCLLQGPTAVSKTSAILYLAARLKQSVIRINLSMQTDVADLIGRWVPANSMQAAPDEATLRRHQALLSNANQQLLQDAGNTPLSVFTRQLIASREGISLPGFCWQDGPVLKALKQGVWLVLDEVNLASSAILERLNSLMEPSPSLTLYEVDNSVLFAKPGFMLFATMNPGHYAGRQTLSDAWLDRFSCLNLNQPTEEDISAMLTQWRTGQCPSVVIGQWQYSAGQHSTEQHSPVLGALECAEADDRLWQGLLQFHMACLQLGAETTLSSRRQLWRVMQFIDTQVQAGTTVSDALRAAIARYYLARLTPETTQTALQLLYALNILPQPEVF